MCCRVNWFLSKMLKCRSAPVRQRRGLRAVRSRIAWRTAHPSRAVFLTVGTRARSRRGALPGPRCGHAARPRRQDLLPDRRLAHRPPEVALRHLASPSRCNQRCETSGRGSRQSRRQFLMSRRCDLHGTTGRAAHPFCVGEMLADLGSAVRLMRSTTRMRFRSRTSTAAGFKDQRARLKTRTRWRCVERWADRRARAASARVADARQSLPDPPVPGPDNARSDRRAGLPG